VAAQAELRLWNGSQHREGDLARAVLAMAVTPGSDGSECPLDVRQRPTGTGEDQGVHLAKSTSGRPRVAAGPDGESGQLLRPESALTLERLA